MKWRSDGLLFGVLVLLPLVAAALSSDREAPIHLQAEYAEMDRKTGISRYRGAVTLDQGSLHLEADEIRIYHAEERLERIEAEGAPARFRQRPDGAESHVTGHARYIEYRAESGRLLLRGEAVVEQAQDTFSGEEILYRMEEATVQAQGDGNGGRVRAVIQPREETTR